MFDRAGASYGVADPPIAFANDRESSERVWQVECLEEQRIIDDSFAGNSQGLRRIRVDRIARCETLQVLDVN